MVEKEINPEGQTDDGVDDDSSAEVDDILSTPTRRRNSGRPLRIFPDESSLDDSPTMDIDQPTHGTSSHQSPPPRMSLPTRTPPPTRTSPPARTSPHPHTSPRPHRSPSPTPMEDIEQHPRIPLPDLDTIVGDGSSHTPREELGPEAIITDPDVSSE